MKGGELSPKNYNMVKKVLLLVFISIFLYNQNVSSYYQLEKKQKIIENKLNYAVKKHLKWKKLDYRIQFRNKLDNISKIEKKYFYLIENVKKSNWLYDYNKNQLRDFNSLGINNIKIQEYWLSLHNKERQNIWLNKYQINELLNSTSYEWSEYQSKKWEMTHKRKNTDIFYNHKNIEKWFANRWIYCKAKWWVTVSESIAKYNFKCNDNECSDELKKSIQTIFLAYMDEKGLTYPENAHYKAITHPNLKYIWLWIKITENRDNNYDYYLTSHYCSELIK